ncbi:outer membrane lipoprotein-sorting protein [bacterium]|nr:outer membrane lipoprotein-sorting protein [bacterium]
MIKMLCTIFCLFSFVALSATTTTNKKGPTGLEVAMKMEKAAQGFKGEQSTMKMILISASKEEVLRQMQGKVLEDLKDGDKSLITFEMPKDVKGTKMLTWSYKDKGDDQWLYLPSFRRVKRISSNAKSSSFMGSEFSYEDLGSQETQKYNFKLVSQTDKEYVLERVSKKKSGYSKQVLVVSKEHLLATKIDYFDRKNELLKTATFDKFEPYTVDGKKMWRANEIHMKNVQTKKESIISWNDRKMGLELKERDFEKKNLKK